MFCLALLRTVVVVGAVWRPVVRLSAAGEKGFTVRGRDPQELFSQKHHFSQNKQQNQTISII